MPNTNKAPEDVMLQDNLMLFWRHEGKGYALRVQQDDEPQNPRTEYDNITTMACFHRRCPMGDRLDEKTPGAFWDRLLRENLTDAELLAMCRENKIPGIPQFMSGEGLGWDDTDGLLEAIYDAVKSDSRLDFAMAALYDRIACLPMWLYEHSGMTVSCGERVYPYNDQFDSSAIGWCVLEKSKALKELQTDEAHWREAAENLIRTDVEIYDMYLQGDCWYYDLLSCQDGPDAAENGTDRNGRHISSEDAWEENDSCGGFMGCYLKASGMLEAVGHGLAEAIESGDYDTGEARSQTVTTWSFIRNGR